jgi:hypothetical protein
MKKFLIFTNVLLLIVAIWQNWRIDDEKKFTEYYRKNVEFYHDKYINLKIHGKY